MEPGSAKALQSVSDTERPGWVVLTVWSRVIIFRSTREVGVKKVLAVANNDEHFGKSS